MLAALVVYAPALNGEFLWDDLYLVGDNPFFKSPIFAVEVFRHHLFLDSLSVYYRPVQNLSYMLDYWLWNREPFGYHLSNVCYHASSGYLIYLLLKKLLPRLLSEEEDKAAIPILSWLVALIWVIHPIHNAAVAYVSGRADSLATLFAVSAWLLYIKSANCGRRVTPVVLNIAAAILCLLALCSKEIALIWMVLFLGYSFAFDARQPRTRKFAATFALLTIAGLYLILRNLPAANPSGPQPEPGVFSVRVLLMLRALGDYAGLIFVPWNLRMDRIIFVPGAYGSAAAWRQQISYEYLSAIGALVLALFISMCFSRRPWQRMRIFGVMWFIVGFLPISNLFPLNAQVAEHWIYMPSIGFLLFIAGCVMALPARYHAVACAVVVVAALGLGARTVARSTDWKDGETFYKRTIEAGGGTPRVHQNLALVYSRKGDDRAAEKVLREAVKRFPGYATARINLGITLMKQGKVREAEVYLNCDKPTAETLAKTYPHTWSAALNLAQMRCDENRSEEAMTILDEAISRSPDVWELARFKSTLLQRSGKLAQAIGVIERYANTHWWHSASHVELGRMLALDGRFDAARQILLAAAKLDIHAVDAFDVLVQLELARNCPAEAYNAEQMIIRREPNQPSRYVMLAAILDRMDRKTQAAEALQQAERLRIAANGL